MNDMSRVCLKDFLGAKPLSVKIDEIDVKFIRMKWNLSKNMDRFRNEIFDS